MSASRWALSAFLVWYIGSLLVAAIPIPAQIHHPQPIAEVRDSALSAHLTPWLDRAAGVVWAIATRLSRSVAPIRPLTGSLLVQSGLAQRWDMFASPLRYDDYLRVKWYVSPAGALARKASWAATRLVLPTDREDRVRGPASLRSFSMDRPLASALDRFHPSGNPTDTASLQAFAEALRPAMRYLTRDFESQRLDRAERVSRVEVWHGRSDLPPPDVATSPRRALRLEVLRNYYAGAIEEPVISALYPPYFAVQTEGDIVWTLEYIEER
jgi:hypothetical protein